MALDIKISPEEITALTPWKTLFPNIDSALAEVARLEALLTLPKGTIHIISDIHGEYTKLRHVINNASGKLRPLVEGLFGNIMPPMELREFLTLIFYPREMLDAIKPRLENPATEREFCHKNLKHLFSILRVLSKRYGLEKIYKISPIDYRDLFIELLHEPSADRGNEYYSALIDTILENGKGPELVHLTVRAVRNLAIDELIIAGDCWDRGQRGDKVVDYMMVQPNVAFTWGNHDAAWLGACIGNEALIAHVVRISLRYRNILQLEEGYGVPLQPIEYLVRHVYKDDPALCFKPKAEGLREPVMLARMQKAIAIIQFKLEGQMLARRPEWNLTHRRLLHTINTNEKTIMIDGKICHLKDTSFPTINPNDPYTLTEDEQICLEKLKTSFLSSDKLFNHMRYLRDRGSMYLVRDNHLIIHGCVPVDANGEFQSLIIDGIPRKGKELYDVLNDLFSRAIESPTDYDRDMMWYLWCGPRSPLFWKNELQHSKLILLKNTKPMPKRKTLFSPSCTKPIFVTKSWLNSGLILYQAL